MDVFVEKTPIRDLLVISHQLHEDNRGFFLEVFRHDLFSANHLPTDFVQLNHSRSEKGVLRGLHFQWNPPMGKLMWVTVGTAFLVAVDIRRGSPTFGRWHGVELSANDKKQDLAPAGFARGFCVLSEHAEIQYLCTGTHNSEGESGVLWNDPEIGIEWPIRDPKLSQKDQIARTLAQWVQTEESRHFTYA